MIEKFDVIVVGVGGMGAAACYHLARRDMKVLGLERFGIPHAMGSSHGVNRIIRLAYYEDPSYVPLLRRAFELWRELGRDFGEQVLYVTGSIDTGPVDEFVFRESKQSCDLHDLPHDVLSAQELMRRYPAFAVPDDFQAVLQPDGGFVASERAIVAHVVGAMECGAIIRGYEPMLSWTTTTSGVRVETTKGSYEAEQLIVSTGAWIGNHVPLLAGVSVPERQVLGWFQPAHPERFSLDTLAGLQPRRRRAGALLRLPDLRHPRLQVRQIPPPRASRSIPTTGTASRTRPTRRFCARACAASSRTRTVRSCRWRLHLHQHAGRALHHRPAARAAR